MSPTSIPSILRLRNFRSFNEELEIELRPLTLVFGHNGAGKSNILRALPLLADSMGADQLDALWLNGRLAPFDLDRTALRYRGHRSDTEDPTIGLTLEWADGACIEWSVAWVPEPWSRFIVKRMRIRVPSEEREAHLRWLETPGEERQQKLTYDLLLHDTAPLTCQVVFKGLLPHSILPSQPFLVPFMERLRGFASLVVWLRSLRPSPGRLTRWTRPADWMLSPQGEDAALLLQTYPSIKQRVSDWYQTSIGAELIVDEYRPRELRVALRRVQAGFDVDLIDAGEGLAEVFPIVTALAMAHDEARPSDFLLALEDAEAHLHPKMQASLVEYLCDVVAESGVSTLLEIHSRNVVLTVQRAILQGRLRPEQVGIYWVRQLEDGSSVTDRITLDDLAYFEGHWPPEALENDMNIAAEIAQLREARIDL